MTDDEFKAFLESPECKYLHVRKLDDGTWAGIIKFFHTWGICTEINMVGYGRRYCYTTEAQAIAEFGKMQSLDDIPEGWERRLPEPFYFTIVGFEGAPHSIGSCMTERDIITHANFQTYSDKGEMPLDKPSDENLKEAVKILNSDGRKLEIFNTATEMEAFIVRADTLGLGGEARRAAIGFHYL